MLQLSTSKLRERHQPQLYHGPLHLISAEFDASHRFQFAAPEGRPVYDFVWLREPASRILSQFEHHISQDRFAVDQLQWDELILQLLNPATCARNEEAHCQQLSDPDKCLGGGFCSIIRNHQTHVMAGFRLYPPEVRESLLQDESRLLCVAQRNLLDMAVVGVTEHFNVSLCLLFHTMGWPKLFDSCCGRGLANGIQCSELTDKLTANVRDTRAQSKIAPAASQNYASK